MGDLAPPDRIAPRIIRLPPPPPATRKVGIVFAWIAAGLIVLGGVLAATIPNNRAKLIVGLMLGGHGVIFGSVAGGMIAYGRRQERSRGDIVAELMARESGDPVAAELALLIADRRTNQFAARLARMNQTNPAEEPPRARIACVGAVELPEPGPYRFEPEVITPTRYLGRYWIAVAIGVAVMALVVVRLTGAVRWLNFIPLGAVGSFGYFYVMAIAFGGLWLWRTTIRPTYIRLAPGVVQILRYRFRGGRPQVKSFPMDAGTMALIYSWSYSQPKARPALLYLVRGETSETIQLAQFPRKSEVLERLWQSMLSTAPPPPLSDEELVG